MSEPNEPIESLTPPAPPAQSPPAAPRPPQDADDPRTRLHELARRLTRARDRGMLMEYLRLRRSLM